MSIVLNVLDESQDSEALASQIEVPEEIWDSFGQACRKAGLIDTDGFFDDPHKAVTFFCS